jgi:CelD/BcsL family acetyltransferase involved in cellulose biosynthesis
VKHNAVAVEFLPAAERPRAAAAWRELEGRLGTAGLADSWVWVETWLAHYGDVVPHAFAFGTAGGVAVGAALVTRATRQLGPVPIPTLHLGTAGEPSAETTHVQYNRCLVDPAHAAGFAAGLVGALRRRTWSRLRLDGFDPAAAAALVQAGLAAGVPFRVEARASPVFDFRAAAGHGELLAALGANTRYSVRRSLRLLAPLSAEWAETPARARAILGELIDLHEGTWAARGLPGAFRTARVRRYHEALVDALLPRGALIAFRVRHGDRTVGCLFNFVEGDRVLAYKSGFARFPDDNRYKPGLVSHVLCMEECRRRGFAQYDLLTGEAPYKRQLANAENVLVWAAAERGPRMRALGAARALYRLPGVQPRAARLVAALAR